MDTTREKTRLLAETIAATVADLIATPNFPLDRPEDQLRALTGHIHVALDVMDDGSDERHGRAVTACRQITWKLGSNWDDGQPARIDRKDATARLAAAVVAEMDDVRLSTDCRQLDSARREEATR